MSIDERELLNRFEEQQANLWREVHHYSEKSSSMSFDQEELQKQAQERGLPPERAGELIKEHALKGHHYLMNFDNNNPTEPPQSPSWRRSISQEDEQRGAMDLFDPMRPQIQEYSKTRDEVLAIRDGSDTERIEELLAEDKLLIAVLQADADSLQIMLATLADFARIADRADPPGIRFPRFMKGVFGMPRPRIRGGWVDPEEIAAQIYNAGSNFVDGLKRKLSAGEDLDPKFGLNRGYIRHWFIRKDASRAINDRQKTDNDGTGLTPKKPEDAEERRQLDAIRRHPIVMDAEASQNPDAPSRHPEVVNPDTFRSTLTASGEVVLGLAEQIEHDNEIQVLIAEFESTLPFDLMEYHQLRIKGIGATEARKQLGLSQSVENNYRNRLKRFCDKKKAQNE